MGQLGVILLMAAVLSAMGANVFRSCSMYPEYNFSAVRAFDDENNSYSLECRVNNATLRSKVFLTQLAFAQNTSAVPSEPTFFSSCIRLPNQEPNTVVSYPGGYATPLVPEEVNGATQCRFKFDNKTRALEPSALVCGFTFFYNAYTIKKCTVAI